MKIRDMTRCAVLAAVLAVCAWLSVPIGDQAVSLQTFGVFLALGLLGGKLGTLTVAVYLLLGVAGLPVFTGFRGGMAMLMGPTGGYLWGFAATAVLYWLLERRLPQWLNMALGMALCYTCGTLWYSCVYASGGAGAVIVTCILPYLLPDAVKIVLALSLSRKLSPLMR